MRQLRGSVVHLTDHLARCEVCREFGTGYCAEISELATIVRADTSRLGDQLVR